MSNTITIQLTNDKALGLLHEMEELHLIKLLIDNNSKNLSQKYRGVISHEKGKELDEKINHLRNEWKSI